MFIQFNNLNGGNRLKKSVTANLSEEQYRLIQEIAIEVDDKFESIFTIIVEKNLLDKLDDKDFKQLVIEAYYSDTLDF